MSRTALAAGEWRKTVASAKTAHLELRYWDRFLVSNYRIEYRNVSGKALAAGFAVQPAASDLLLSV